MYACVIFYILLPIKRIVSYTHVPFCHDVEGRIGILVAYDLCHFAIKDSEVPLVVLRSLQSLGY